MGFQLLGESALVGEPAFSRFFIENVGLFELKIDGGSVLRERLEERSGLVNQARCKASIGAGLATTLPFFGEVEEASAPDVADREKSLVESVVDSRGKSDVKGASAGAHDGGSDDAGAFCDGFFVGNFEEGFGFGFLVDLHHHFRGAGFGCIGEGAKVVPDVFDGGV
ncbi:MAG: hypothetical protein RIS92_3117, partial [Verrucomicrobiota bacterium]